MYLGNSQWLGVAGAYGVYRMCLEDSETSEMGWASFEKDTESLSWDSIFQYILAFQKDGEKHRIEYAWKGKRN